MKINLNDILGKEIIPGFKGKFIHGKDMTLAFWKVKKGSSIPTHTIFTSKHFMLRAVRLN